MPHSEVDLPLQELLKNSSIALALASAQTDNRLVGVNDKFCTLTGYDASDVVGHNCRLLQTSPNGRRAENTDARTKIKAFLEDDRVASVRTLIVNFRKDNTPFVNLLFMSKLRSSGNKVRYIFASQFDVSRTHPELLQSYDEQLKETLSRLQPMLSDHDVLIEGTLATIANSTTIIAQAKLTLADVEKNVHY